MNNISLKNSHDNMKNDTKHPHIFVSQIERGKATAQVGKVITILQILGLQLAIEKGSAGVVNHNE